MSDETSARGGNIRASEGVDDAELLRRYADEKSEEAFAELVRRHIDLVHAVALRKVGGDASLAGDVAQQVFTAVARKAAMLRGHPAFIGWLFTTTHFAATQLVRAERRRQVREQRAQTMNEMTSDNDTAVDWERLRPTLDDLIGELDERDREAVLLRFFEGRSLREVGAKIRLTEEGARSRVDRALAKLAAMLSRRGITSTSSALAVALANQVGAAAPAGLAANVTGAALAGVAGASGAAGIFTFMSTTKIVGGIAGVAVLLALGTAVFEFNAARVSDTALVAVGEERAELRARLAVMEKRAAQAEAGHASAQAELEELRARAGQATASAGPARSAAIVRPVVSPAEYALDHPEARPAYLQRAALTARTRFDRFFQSAGLTGEQQEKFLKTTMDEANKWLEMLALIRANGGFDPNGPPLDRAVQDRLDAAGKQFDAETTAELRELLGERMKPLMHYMATIPERNVVDQLAGLLYATEPLTAQQADQLTQILAENAFRPQATPSPTNTLGSRFVPREALSGAQAQGMHFNGAIGLGPNFDFPWLQQALVTDAAMARAGAALTPAQLAALARLQAEQAARLQLVPPAEKPKDAKAGK